MRVTLVVPPWAYWVDPFRIQPLYELGFATLINSRFSESDVEVEISDLRGTSQSERLGLIPESDFYFYWMMKSGDHNDAREVVEEVRGVYPKAKHAAGGTHVSITTVTQEACSSVFDAIVIGPGEESLLQMIRDLKNGGLKRVYRTNYAEVQYGDYLWPRRHYLPEKSIVGTEDLFGRRHRNIRGTTAAFSRGCPFSCSFCVLNVPNMLQMRTPESMAEEIEYLKKEYDIQGLSLRDEICIPLNKKVAVPFLETLGRSNIIWRGQTVVRSNKDMIALAAQSGCVELAFGVESASQQVLDIHTTSKRQSVEDVKEAIRFSKSVGIKVKVCLILGLPGEPPDILDVTKKFLTETEPDYVNLSTFCPYPGSDISSRPEYYGIRFIDNDWGKHAHLLYRYSDEEDVEGLPFEYAPENRWGKTFSRAAILQNVREIQHYVKEKGMTY